MRISDPLKGVTAIIQPAAGGGYLLDCYGPLGGPLARPNQTRHFDTVEAAAREAMLRHGRALEHVRYWTPDTGYQEVEAS